jgi:hypothetical protein
MSVDYGAYVIFGVEGHEVGEVEVEETPRTKYDENTGDPYQVTDREETEYFCGKVMDEKGHCFPENEIYKFNEEAERKTKLEAVITDYDGDNFIFGIRLASLGAFDPKCIDISKYEEWKEKFVSEIRRVFDYDASGLEPKLWVVMIAG